MSCERSGKSISRSDNMKAEYDFSIAKRGKFYRADASFSFPVYLDPDVNDFLSKLAEQKNVDVQDLVNDLLRADMNLIQSIQ
jgi:cytidylate kinase